MKSFDSVDRGRSIHGIGKYPYLLILLFSVCIFMIPKALYSQEPGKAVSGDPKELLELGDASWEKRGTKLDTDNARAVEYYRAAAAADPFSYEAHWKCARALWWLTDQMLAAANVKGGEHEKLGREGMELAGRAKLINPDGIEGHLYYALTAFHYAFGIGMIEAMKGGVFDAICEDLTWCQKRDETYGGGIVLRGLSSYFRIVPWPKRDNDKSLKLSTEAVKADETSVRNVVYLAAAYEMLGMGDKAVNILEVAVAMEGDKEQEPDFKRWKKFAKRCIDEGRVIETETLF
ncbi:MAG: hypothetical protein JW984_01395 [Deltaproteobacteria bacterium]|uniref:Uncharacterized protein n=1 Tax=Candidatus Zymogenus saltonus TaxID=2844893 RepID=A0A9D8KD04_9DELT|nr:hypothetical protein [Candidatus Zymogenus saltonus]